MASVLINYCPVAAPQECNVNVIGEQAEQKKFQPLEWSLCSEPMLSVWFNLPVWRFNSPSLITLVEEKSRGRGQLVLRIALGGFAVPTIIVDMMPGGHSIDSFIFRKQLTAHSWGRPYGQQPFEKHITTCWPAVEESKRPSSNAIIPMACR